MIAEAGPGHGRGLSQHGALQNANGGQNVDQILGHYYPGAESGTIGPASVSVRLQGHDGAEPVVFSDAGARVAGQVLNPGEAARLIPLPDGGAHIVVTDGCDGAVLWETSAGDPWVYPIDPNPNRPADEHLTLCGGGAYRGSLGVAAENGEPRTVNRVDVQDYLLGVVPAEMPADWAPAALEAQAVAARSYALAEARWPYAQTCDTTDCQVYSGTAQEDPRTTAAVEGTAGRVLLRDGRILRAEYSAAPDGGSPADIQTFEVGPTPAELTVATPMPAPPVNPDTATSSPDGSSPGVPADSVPHASTSPEGSKSGSVPGAGAPVPRTPEGSLPVSPNGTTPGMPGVAPGQTPSPIDTAYAEMGGARSPVGLPVTPEMSLPDDAGSYRLFENGVIVYTPDLGAQVVDFTTLMQLVPDLDDPAPGSADSGAPDPQGAGPGATAPSGTEPDATAPSGTEPGATTQGGSTAPGGTESGNPGAAEGDSGQSGVAPGRVPAGRAGAADTPQSSPGGPVLEGDRPAAVPGAQKIPMDLEVTKVS
ncbi:SpoIID/LytB domain-containing protein [Nocardia sp. NPDC019395]|uniref:SpoIID/LytB domain-containing protein n=1 Tax=Nocardia sp. NPDC019395 TaxID=3154686 RepID=UPI00340245B5